MTGSSTVGSVTTATAATATIVSLFTGPEAAQQGIQTRVAGSAPTYTVDVGASLLP
ncbi:MAG: hypothetical protein K8W52_40475 [Deltaproteobacteria bacterium]|nr:hypothetical protein [Deltaproteobacteria bacterium]